MTTRLSGVVKFFDATKGWGFISRADGEGDVFVHLTEVRKTGRDRLDEHDEVSFVLTEGKAGKGPRATELRIL